MVRQPFIRTKTRPMRLLAFGLFLAFGFGIIVIQTAPSVRQAFLPVRTTISDIFSADQTSQWMAYITGKTYRERRVAALQEEIRELKVWQARAIALEERVRAYQRILNLQGEPPSNAVTARVITENKGPFTRSLLANAGRAQGVETDYVAVNENGLVGRVIQVGERSSRILLVTDFSSRVPVMGEISGLRAVLYGTNQAPGALNDRPEMEDFIENERVLTTGEGGVFPRGIIVGIAKKQGQDWRVALAMQRSRDEYLRLLPPMRIPEPGGEADRVSDLPSTARADDTLR